MHSAIVPIVEGKGEVESIPTLIRRLLQRREEYRITVAKPLRAKRYSIVRERELEREIEFASQARRGAAGILLVLDADDDSPSELGPQLLHRGSAVTHLPFRVVLAKRELEAWFLGAKDSLRGFRGIREDAVAPDEPEQIRGAKARLERNMIERTYVEVDDQPAFAAQMEVDLASERCASFAYFVRSVDALVDDILGTSA